MTRLWRDAEQIVESGLFFDYYVVTKAANADIAATDADHAKVKMLEAEQFDVDELWKNRDKALSDEEHD